MIIDDFPDIHRRMLGELKAKPKPEPEPYNCYECEDRGWVEYYNPTGLIFHLCIHCCNPKGLPSP